jgi:hypothetical protein
MQKSQEGATQLHTAGIRDCSLNFIYIYIYIYCKSVFFEYISQQKFLEFSKLFHNIFRSKICFFISFIILGELHPDKYLATYFEDTFCE